MGVGEYHSRPRHPVEIGGLPGAIRIQGGDVADPHVVGQKIDNIWRRIGSANRADRHGRKRGEHGWAPAYLHHFRSGGPARDLPIIKQGFLFRTSRRQLSALARHRSGFGQWVILAGGLPELTLLAALFADQGRGGPQGPPGCRGGSSEPAQPQNRGRFADRLGLGQPVRKRREPSRRNDPLPETALFCLWLRQACKTIVSMKTPDGSGSIP